MDDDLATLARCVGDVDLFAAEHWGRSPMLRRRTGRFDDLLDVDAIETILLSTARRPTFRLVRDGRTLPPGRSTTTIRLAGTTVDDAADVARIVDEVAGGATLVLQGLQRTWLPLARFCRRLERATSHAVQANAYLTPPGAAGLGRHADGHDVLVLQVGGSKGWDVAGLGAVDIDAGDVLYLPRGTQHAAAAQQETSLHLTIGLLRDTYRQALGRVLDAAGDELDLDRPLPLGFARPERTPALAAELGELLDKAARLLEAADASSLAAGEAQRASRRRKPLLSGHLRSVLLADGVDDTTVVRRRRDNPATLTDGDDGRLVLRLSDRQLRLPAHTRDSLETLLAADGEVGVGDLPGLDGGGRAVLARRLVREGWLEIVDRWDRP